MTVLNCEKCFTFYFFLCDFCNHVTKMILHYLSLPHFIFVCLSFSQMNKQLLKQVVCSHCALCPKSQFGSQNESFDTQNWKQEWNLIKVFVYSLPPVPDLFCFSLWKPKYSSRLNILRRKCELCLPVQKSVSLHYKLACYLCIANWLLGYSEWLLSCCSQA